MKILSIVCYIFAALDFGLYYLADVDITGVFWSPYVACALGAFFSWLASNNSNQVVSENEAAESESYSQYDYSYDDGLTEEELKERLLEIFQTEFPQYKVRQDIAVTKIVRETNESFKLYENRPHKVYKAEWGMNYTFALCEEKKLIALVMVSCRSSYNKVAYLISRMYAKKRGVPYISLYYDMPNEREYLVKHIREKLA